MSQSISSSAELLQKVKDVVDRDVRFMLQADGGDIEVVEIDENKVVKVRLFGSCVNCVGAAMTLSGAVEVRIKDAVPEIAGVEQIP